MKILLSRANEIQISGLVKKMPNAIGICGPQGSGKVFLAHYLKDKFAAECNDENVLIVRPNDKRRITIEQARQLQKFLQLKPADSKTKRVIILEDADLMTPEAQNAILKTIEESPLDTAIILTISYLSSVLPTIISRLFIINVSTPTFSMTKDFFFKYYSIEQITKAYAISDGRVGLMTTLLKHDDHELLDRISHSKKLLSSTSFERICMVESLSKTDVDNILDALLIVSKAAFKSAVRNDQYEKINKLLEVRENIFESIQKTRSTPNNKLLLTNLMLRI